MSILGDVYYCSLSFLLLGYFGWISRVLFLVQNITAYTDDIDGDGDEYNSVI